MAETNRDFNLRIKARDETGPGVRSAESALNRLAAAQKRTQARRDLYSGATKSAQDLKVAYDAAAASAAKFGRQMDDVKNWRWSKDVIEDPQNLAANFDQSRAAARQAKAEYLAAAAALSKLQGRQGGFAAFDTIATSAKRADAAVGNLSRTGERVAASSTKEGRAALELAAAFRNEEAAALELKRAQDDLDAVQRRADASAEDLISAHKRLAAAHTGVERAARRSAAAQKQAQSGDFANQVTTAYTSRQGRGPLGLRPYELQNLGYQVNDLFTQIASGTPVMQAFAQQGGQIAQIFPKATTALLRFSPAIAAGLLIISPFVVALKQMGDEAKRLSAVSDAMAVSGNAADYARADLVRYAETLGDIGVKAKDVGGVVSTALREGLRPEYFDRFATAARGLSKVTGEELTDSINTVTEAFTGNADEILALDDKLGFLSRAERKHIEQLRESKRDAEARTEAFAIFERRYGSIAAKMDGDWKQILSNFGDAWGAFGRLLLSGVQWDAIKSELGGIIAMVASLTSKLPGVQRTAREVYVAQHEAYDRQIRRLQGRPDNASTRGRGGPTVAEERARLIRERDEVIRNITVIDQTVEANRPKPRDTTFDPPKPANTDTGRDRAAERLAEQQREYRESLDAANERRAFEVTLIGQAEREAKILDEIEQQRVKAQDVGLKLTAEQEASIRNSVGALYDAEKAQQAISKIEAARLDLAKARNEVETKDVYIQRMLAAELIGATDEQRAAYTALLSSMYDIEASKRRQTELEKGVSEQQAIQQELQQQIAAAADAGDNTRASLLQEQLARVNGTLLQAIGNILEFWRTQSGPEAEAAILKWVGIEEAIRTAGQKAVVTGTEIDQMLSQGGANAFDQFAQSIAEGENAFDSLRDAFLSFAADFLRQIAVMIAQQLLLNALGASNGKASGTGSSIAGAIAGLFRHDGGLVGRGGGFRPVSPGLFTNATRYHSGGIAGLAPNEVPAILLRNEEVLTEDDPRHRNNGGLASGGSKVKIVNVFDAADAFERGLGTERGEQVMLNFVRRNAGAFKAVLG